jgi:xanthine dehydrogenase iron-sulfur cluster and FAD-binding subunit A
MTDCITFLLNDVAIRADGVDPATTLLDWLRNNPQLRGTHVLEEIERLRGRASLT